MKYFPQIKTFTCFLISETGGAQFENRSTLGFYLRDLHKCPEDVSITQLTKRLKLATTTQTRFNIWPLCPTPPIYVENRKVEQIKLLSPF